MIDLNLLGHLQNEAHSKIGKYKGTELVAHSVQVHAAAVYRMGATLEKRAALLHDLIEDCRPIGWSPDQYADDLNRRLSIDDETLSIVLQLTRRDDVAYFDYIGKLADMGCTEAVFVKLCDLSVNIDRCKANPKGDLLKRYERAFDILATKRSYDIGKRFNG